MTFSAATAGFALLAAARFGLLAAARFGAGKLGAVGTFLPLMAIAGVVAFYTRSSLWTMGTGMAALWVLQAVS